MSDDFKLACLLTGGPDYIISVEGKRYRFEMPPYGGAGFLNAKGEIKDAARIPKCVWTAVSLWVEQGKQVDSETGLCIWHHEPELILRQMGGRNYLVVGQKDPKAGE